MNTKSKFTNDEIIKTQKPSKNGWESDDFSDSPTSFNI